jgi:hypothetical protein
MQTIAKINKEAGLRAFWRGNGVNVLKIAPESSIKFLAFDMLKSSIATDPANVTGQERFVAGGAAGAIAQASIYPLEICKTRLAVSPAGAWLAMRACVMRVCVCLQVGVWAKMLARLLPHSLHPALSLTTLYIMLVASLHHMHVHSHHPAMSLTTLLLMISLHHRHLHWYHGCSAHHRPERGDKCAVQRVGHLSDWDCAVCW